MFRLRYRSAQGDRVLSFRAKPQAQSRGLDGEMSRAIVIRTGACSANSRPFDSAIAPLKVTEKLSPRRSKSLQAVQVVWNMSSRCRRITVGVFVFLIAPIKKKRRRSSPNSRPRKPWIGSCPTPQSAACTGMQGQSKGFRQILHQSKTYYLHNSCEFTVGIKVCPNL